MINFYAIKEGKAQGPFSLEQVVSMIREGRLLISTLAWREGMNEWRPIYNIPELVSAIMPPIPEKTERAGISITGPPVLTQSLEGQSPQQPTETDLKSEQVVSGTSPQSPKDTRQQKPVDSGSGLTAAGTGLLGLLAAMFLGIKYHNSFPPPRHLFTNAASFQDLRRAVRNPYSHYDDYKIRTKYIDKGIYCIVVRCEGGSGRARLQLITIAVTKDRWDALTDTDTFKHLEEIDSQYSIIKE